MLIFPGKKKFPQIALLFENSYLEYTEYFQWNRNLYKRRPESWEITSEVVQF